MRNKLMVILFGFFTAIPAFAKAHDVYQVSCNTLWSAIETVLENPADYRVLTMNDAEQKASFFVVGELTTYTDTVAVTESGDGCAMNLKISQVGGDNSDERGFRKRLGKSLAKLQAGQPAKPTQAPGHQ